MKKKNVLKVIGFAFVIAMICISCKNDVTETPTPTTNATYAITYDSNNCTSGTAPSAQTKTENTDLTLASNSGNLARKSCTFTGWNTSMDGSGTDYAAGATYSGNTTLTLFAKWKVASNLKLAFSQQGTESDWRNANTTSVKNAITTQGATLLFSAGDGNQATQIAAIRDFIAQKADAIILTPIQETGWTTVLGEAKAAGIPVIFNDRTITEDASLYVAQITSDLELEGKKIADQLVALKGTGTVKILELEGPTGNVAATARKKGFDAVIAKNATYSIVTSVAVASWDNATAKTITAAQLTAHPEINVIFAHNDGMALAAIDALKTAGKTPGTGSGQITVLSINAMRAALQAVLNGDMYASCEDSPDYGPTAVDVTVKYLEGRLTGKVFFANDNVFTKADLTQAIVNARLY